MADNSLSPLSPTTTYRPFTAHVRDMALPFSERKILLILLDLLALNVGLVLSLTLRSQYRVTRALLARHFHWFILLSILWLFFAHAFDAYDLQKVVHLSKNVISAFKAITITSLVYLLIPYLSPALPQSRSLLAAYFLFTIGSLLVGRGIYSLVLSQPIFRRRVLVIGAGWAGRTIAETLLRYGEGTYDLVGFVDDDPNKQNVSLHILDTTFQVLGSRDSLATLILQRRVNTLVLAITHAIDGRLLQVLMDCLERGVEVIPMPVLYEEITGRVPVEHVGDNWYVAMPISHPLTRTFNRMIKRGMDIVLASLGLLFLLPFVPFIALAIYLDSPGPIFYTQWRVGQGGRLFKAYKFRSMVPDAEKDRPVWARKNDPRVTRVGRILRKTHVDEFPQFLNILKGEMSAVGPRPERPEFVEGLAKEIPFYRVRHAVKPGMAGWALVKYGYASSKEDAAIKLEYDLYYIKHWSPWFDLIILAKTVIDTVTFGGR